MYILQVLGISEIILASEFNQRVDSGLSVRERGFQSSKKYEIEDVLVLVAPKICLCISATIMKYFGLFFPMYSQRNLE